MSAPDLVIFNTLEQLLSTDLNRIGGLAGKSAQDAMIAIAGGIVASEAPDDVVRRGLDVIPGSGMQVLVGVGELMRYDATITSADLSKYQLGRLDAQTAVAITAAHATLHRIDLVYAQVATVDQEQQLRNVLTLPARSVTPTLVYKVRRPSLTVGVVNGTAAAFPTFTGHVLPTGAVPLFYVFVDAASTSILSDRLFDVRVRFHPAALAKSHGREEGLFVDAASATAVRLSPGRAWAEGVLGELAASTTIARTLLLGAWVANTEYHFYLIPTGGGRTAPICKTSPSNLVVAASTTAPDAYGRPSAAISYNPALLAPTQPPAFVQPSTTIALYLGTIRADSSGNFEASTIPLAKSGLEWIANQSIVSPGWPGRPSGWIKAPSLAWGSATTVVSSGVVVIAGVVYPYSGLTATMPTSLINGTELASTFYYCFVRPAAVPGSALRSTPRELAMVLSAQGPNGTGGLSTPETGYAADDYVYVGSVFNDSASDFRRFYRMGAKMFWLRDREHIYTTADIAISPAFQTITAVLPSGSEFPLVHGNARAVAAGSDSTTLSLFHEASSVPFFFTLFQVDTETEDRSFGPFDVMTSSKTFRANRTAFAGGTFTLDLWQVGYTEGPALGT